MDYVSTHEFELDGVDWSHSPWSLSYLGWIRINLLWLNYPPWIDSSWLTLVWFDPIELELPYLVYKSMFDILGLGVVFHGSFGWLLIMVVHTFDGESLGNHECSAMWMNFVLEALWPCMVFTVSPKNLSLCPLLGYVLDLHINLDGEGRYLDGLRGLDYHSTW